MANISYTYQPHQPVLACSKSLQEHYDKHQEFGGFNPQSRTFTPLKLEGVAIGRAGFGKPEIPGYGLYETVSAAVEAGVLDDEMWPSQLFADRASFDVFVESLTHYEECYKLLDPWWNAFCALLGRPDGDEGYNTSADLAERFSEALDDLPMQWS